MLARSEMTQEIKDYIRISQPNRVSGLSYRKKVESYRRPFFAAKPCKINDGEQVQDSTRWYLSGLHPRRTECARACRAERKLAKFPFHVLFTMHLHGKRARRGPTFRNSHNKWRNESLQHQVPTNVAV